MRYALREGEEVVRKLESLAFGISEPGFIFIRWRNGVEGKICRNARPNLERRSEASMRIVHKYFGVFVKCQGQPPISYLVSWHAACGELFN